MSRVTSEGSSAVLNLLHEISRCPEIEAARRSAVHPCAAIVRCQSAVLPSGHQVPEPWNGRIETARLLFISSNPSIDELEEYPTASTAQDERADFFNNRFGGGAKQWVRDGLRPLRRDGSYPGEWTRFWASVRARAAELLPLPVRPGLDYAITEIVHCKSRGELGVTDAEVLCSDKFLSRVVSISAARVVIVLGEVARRQVTRVLAPQAESRTREAKVAGQRRTFVFLPHPNSRGGTKTLKGNLDETELTRLQAELH